MIQLFMLIHRLRGQLYAQFFKDFNIHIRQHDGGVDLAAAELGKLGQSFFCGLVVCAARAFRGGVFVFSSDPLIPSGTSCHLPFPKGEA